MIDKRELILARLFEILQTVTGVAADSCVRNRMELPANKRPSIILLDADEEADLRSMDRGRPMSAPNRIILKPEIYAALDQSKPNNEDVGQNLNAFRASILRAILNDTALAVLAGTNGQVAYVGSVTDLARGRSANGEIGMMFHITYVLNPADLAA